MKYSHSFNLSKLCVANNYSLNVYRLRYSNSLIALFFLHRKIVRTTVIGILFRQFSYLITYFVGKLPFSPCIVDPHHNFLCPTNYPLIKKLQ